MKPRRKRSTAPSGPYLLGLRMTTRRELAPVMPPPPRSEITPVGREPATLLRRGDWSRRHGLGRRRQVPRGRRRLGLNLEVVVDGDDPLLGARDPHDLGL